MKGKGGKTLSGRDIQIGVEKISYKKFGFFFSIDQADKFVKGGRVKRKRLNRSFFFTVKK